MTQKQKQVSKNNQKQTGNALYVQCNTEALSCNHCYNGKAMSVTYSECVNVCARACAALYIQHAMRMRHIIICGLSGSTAFFHIIS
jgi:hypothetical protein